MGFLIQNEDKFDIFIGNNKKVTLTPSYHEMEDCDSNVAIEVDKIKKNITFATEFYITADFKAIIQSNSARVNIIGYTSKNGVSEANTNVSIDDLDPKYSIDEDHKGLSSRIL